MQEPEKVWGAGGTGLVEKSPEPFFASDAITFLGFGVGGMQSSGVGPMDQKIVVAPRSACSGFAVNSRAGMDCHVTLVLLVILHGVLDLFSWI